MCKFKQELLFAPTAKNRCSLTKTWSLARPIWLKDTFRRLSWTRKTNHLLTNSDLERHLNRVCLAMWTVAMYHHSGLAASISCELTAVVGISAKCMLPTLLTCRENSCSSAAPIALTVLKRHLHWETQLLWLGCQSCSLEWFSCQSLLLWFKLND